MNLLCIGAIDSVSHALTNYLEKFSSGSAGSIVSEETSELMSTGPLYKFQVPD